MQPKQMINITEALAMPKTQYMYVNAFEIVGEHVAVRTTHGEVMDCLDEIGGNTMEEQKTIYRRVVTTLRRLAFDKEKFNKMYDKNDKNWQNFCDDVVLAYCVRCVLHNKPIPVMANVDDKEFGERLDKRSAK